MLGVDILPVYNFSLYTYFYDLVNLTKGQLFIKYLYCNLTFLAFFLLAFIVWINVPSKRRKKNDK